MLSKAPLDLRRTAGQALKAKVRPNYFRFIGKIGDHRARYNRFASFLKPHRPDHAEIFKQRGQPMLNFIFAAALLFVIPSDGGTRDTAPFDQPPGDVVLVIDQDAAHNLITVYIKAQDETWRWNDDQSHGQTVTGILEPQAECRGDGRGRYTGTLEFWRPQTPDDYDDQPRPGQLILHRVVWTTASCSPADMQVIVFMPGE